MLSEQVQRALAHDRTVDITTVGRRSGQSRRIVADIPARAHPITDPAERRRVLSGILAGIGREDELEEWVDRSPLIEVELLWGLSKVRVGTVGLHG